jgi:hypothetical protein
MRRRLITSGVLLGGLALAAAACGSGGPSVQARQTGDTTATTAEPTTTTTAPPSTTTAPVTTAPPATTTPEPPCTPDALTAAHVAKFGAPSGVLKVQSCIAGWATSSETKGYNPPLFTLYRAEGDHWVALNQSAGRLCQGQGVPKDVAPQVGCDT